MCSTQKFEIVIQCKCILTRCICVCWLERDCECWSELLYLKQKSSEIDCPEIAQPVGMWPEANEQSANEGGKSLCLLLHLLTSEQLAWVLSGALVHASSWELSDFWQILGEQDLLCYLALIFA